ncbi:DEAD/DEAH box helicase [Vibrio agarivorans]|uniref:DEAD/DEAH box helicase n=1 Tax=Vibrio agarivorans TaxID=153622 RepID=A0ABT7Y7J5_9VIBR|nr:DEAD/DEAH box helicase [Vibrio agarivorans]MDN2483920.1 DEAD/DEAH box helicase [Vibrio agarivorans]
MELRPYQKRVKEDLWNWFRRNPVGNPLIKCPTGSGKTHILAEIIVDALSFKSSREVRVLVLTHNTTLVEQNFTKFGSHNRIDVDYGLNSASLGRRDKDSRVLFAGVQSIYKDDDIGVFDLIVVDECHLIPKTGDGMYRTLFDKQLSLNPKLRVVGLTATDYRLSSGKLTEGEGRVFTDICAEITIQELLDLGYLVPIRYLNTNLNRTMTGVTVGSNGDFSSKQAAQRMMDDNGTNTFIADAIKIAKKRKLKKWKVYCTTLEHCEEVLEELRDRGVTAELYTSKVSTADRQEILKRFSTNRLKALVSCEALITGFDETRIDFIINLKPTKSRGRWIQLCGRGMRPHGLGTDKSKKECFLADYTTNTSELGRAELIDYTTTAIEKSGINEKVTYCPSCSMANHIYQQSCDYCGHEYQKDRIAVMTAKAVLSRVTTPRDDLSIFVISHSEIRVKTYTNRRVVQLTFFGRNGGEGRDTKVRPFLNEFLTLGATELEKRFFEFFTGTTDQTVTSECPEYLSRLSSMLITPKAVVTVKNTKEFNASVAFVTEGDDLHWKHDNTKAIEKMEKQGVA